MDDLHRAVERGYDAIAERYAEVTRRNRGSGTYFRSFLDGVLDRVPEGGRILDLGCGAGLVAADSLGAAEWSRWIDRRRNWP